MFQLWPITIHRYGLMYLAGIVIGYIILYRLARQPRCTQILWPKISHLLRTQLDDLITWIVLGIIIGGRLGHVLIYDPNYYLANPLEIVQIRKWGMSFVGGFIWVWLSVWFWVRRHALTVREFYILTDLVVLVLPIGIALWRIGNAINQELIGRVFDWSTSQASESTLQKLHLLRTYSSVDTQLRRNTNLLEWVGEWVLWFVVTVILLLVQKAKKIRRPWLITWGFMIFYSVVRFMLEPLRDNPSSEYITLMWQMINKTQLWMIAFVVVGIIVCVRAYRFPHQK